jgi:hypothetical protein
MARSKSTEVVEVPSIDDMDDDTFCKHMDLRHAESLSTAGPLSNHPDRAPEWIGPYRVFHDRLHDIAVPGQFDHEHTF